MNLPPVKEAIESLESNDVKYELYDKVRIEPTDTRYTSAYSSLYVFNLCTSLKNVSLGNYFGVELC